MKITYIYLDIFLMVITGLVLIDSVALPWSLWRVVEFLHILLSFLVSVLFVIPFLFKHIKESMYVHKHKSLSGILFGFAFVLLISSGVYLALVGRRGGDIIAEGAFYIHLYTTFFFIVVFLWHIKGVLFSRTFIHSMMLVGILMPILAYSDTKEPLTNITLDNNLSRYHRGEWTHSVSCKECHPLIFQQWANSNHRHLADSNPYYMVLENLAGMDRGVEFRQWCMGCHNPSAVTTKQKRTTHFMDDNTMPDPLFVKDSANLVQSYNQHPNRVEQGVSCVACHRIVQTDTKGNSAYHLALSLRKKYLYEESTQGVKRWISNKLINAKPTQHKKEYMDPLYKKSQYCAACHNEFLPHNAKVVVSTYEQWKNSPFNNPKEPQKHKTCIDCHMKTLKDGEFVQKSGRVTTGGVQKQDIKTHYFTGGNHFLSGLKSKTNEDQSLQLLRQAAKLDVALQNNELRVGITNVAAGHNLPTGVADFRELWLDITVLDKNDDVVFSSGKLDESGNVEQGSVMFKKVFGDKDAKEVGLFFWRYETLLEDSTIPAGKRVEHSFKLSPKSFYPLRVRVRLQFRIYPQWVTDIVKVTYPQLPDPPVVTLVEVEKEYVR